MFDMKLLNKENNILILIPVLSTTELICVCVCVCQCCPIYYYTMVLVFLPLIRQSGINLLYGILYIVNAS